MAGVEVYRADAAFEADGQQHPAGTFVVPMAQVFALRQGHSRAADLPGSAAVADLAARAALRRHLAGRSACCSASTTSSSASRSRMASRLTGSRRRPGLDGRVTGSGSRQPYVFDYRGPDAARAMNRLMKDGARLALEPAGAAARRACGCSTRTASRSTRSPPTSARASRPPRPARRRMRFPSRPRIGMLAVDRRQHGRRLDALGAGAARVRPDDAAQRRGPRGKLRDKFDVVIFPDQNPNAIVSGATGQNIRPEYRGGIGDEGNRRDQGVRRRRRHARHARTRPTSRSSVWGFRSRISSQA